MRGGSTTRRLAALLAVSAVLLVGEARDAAAQPFRRIVTGDGITGDGLVGGDASGLVVFAGGFARPRPHLVDLVGDARLDLVVQDEPGRLRLFERIGGDGLPGGGAAAWRGRTDRLTDAGGAPVVVGEWVRFADADGDGDADLLTEAVPGLVAYYRRDADGLHPTGTPPGAPLLRTDGVPVAIDRQNLPAAADLTGDGRIDLLTAQADGTLTFFEGAAPGPDGRPRFRPPVDQYQGIQIVGNFGSALLDDGRRTADDRHHTTGGRHPTTNHQRPTTNDQPPTTNAPKHGASALTLVDVDGDGDFDVVWGDFFSPSLYLLRNTGTATAPRLVRASDAWPTASAPMTTGYNATATGDVTGDGIPDLVVGVIGGAFGATEGGAPLTVRAGLGGEAFGAPMRAVATFDAGTASRVAVLPRAGGRAALLVATDESIAAGRLLRLEPVGSGTAFRSTFVVLADAPFGAAPAALANGDLAVGGFDGRVRRFVPDGSGGYRAAEVLASVVRGQFATPAVGDLDGDGRADLVVGTADGRVAFFRGDAAGGFALATETLVPTDPTARRTAPALGDATGDGRLDLAIGDESGRIRLFAGDGRGGLAPMPDASGQTVPPLDALPVATPVFVDVDADGDLDVLAGADGGGLVRFTNERLASVAAAPPAPASVATLRAYPTPAHATVRLDTGGREATIVVTDALGRTVARASGADVTLDVGAWPPGLYAATATDAATAEVRRTVVVVAR